MDGRCGMRGTGTLARRSRRSRVSTDIALQFIPLDRIRISSASQALLDASHAPPALAAPDGMRELILVLQPPVVTVHPDQQGVYLTVGDAHLVRWLRSLPPAEQPRQPIPCVVVNTHSLEVETLSAIQAYLMPWLFGRLGARAIRVARQHLRSSGIAGPRTRTRRERLVSLKDH